MCIVTCELHSAPLSAAAMAALHDSSTTQASLCAGALPWAHGIPAVDFTAAKDEKELAQMAQPLREAHAAHAATCAC